jgi:hypothetical protein
MNEENQTYSAGPGTAGWVGVAVAILAVASVAGVATGWEATKRANTIERNLNNQIQTMKQSDDVLGQRLAQTEDTDAQVRGELEVVTSKMQLTQDELAKAREQAGLIKKEDAQKLAVMEDSVKTELASKANADDVNKLGTDVTGVKGDLATTQQSLEMARGEMGTLIARNHDEISQLRRLGERDYYEFTLTGKGQKNKVGDLQVELRGTNTKKNLFSLALYADDMRLEKKNRSVDEPIYFYTREYKAPLELVVNQVSKDKIEGYVSVPKSAVASNMANSSGSGQ